MRPGEDVVDNEGAIRPLEDNGFRMSPTEPYAGIVFPSNPPTKELYGVDHVHVDDIATRESAGLRGVDYITINLKSVNDRIAADIAHNIAVRELTAERSTTL